MDIELTAEESGAVQTALRRYVSDLRSEISDTDNPGYKRSLRAEREALEAAIAKLDAAGKGGTTSDEDDSGALQIVRLWWIVQER